MAFHRVSSVMRPVSGSTSVKRTSAPSQSAAVAVERKVMAGTTTKSPGPTGTSLPIRASCSAAVPLEHATACSAPTAAAKARSNSPTDRPMREPLAAQRRDDRGHVVIVDGLAAVGQELHARDPVPPRLAAG
jgi:hypothetical protein